MNLQEMDKPRIAFVGAGAMGSWVGGRIAQSGHDVTLIDAWRENVEAIKRSGIELSGTEGVSSARVNAMHVDDVASLASQPVDVAFVAVKSYDTEWAARLIGDRLSSTGFVVSLQNGINEPTIARVVGEKRTMGCIASTIGVALRGPGHVERTYRPGGSAYTVFRVGELTGGVTERAEFVASLLRCVDSAEATANLAGERWSKLAANSMHNGLAAATGLGHKGVYSDPTARWLAIRLGAEAVRVGRKLGFELKSVRGIPPDLLEAAGYGDPDALRSVARVIAGWQARLTDEGRPSTAQDVIKGRRTEIDFINGVVCAKAKEVGTLVPCQEAIVTLVKRVEAGEMAPAVTNISGI